MYKFTVGLLLSTASASQVFDRQEHQMQEMHSLYSDVTDLLTIKVTEDSIKKIQLAEKKMEYVARHYQWDQKLVEAAAKDLEAIMKTEEGLDFKAFMEKITAPGFKIDIKTKIQMKKAEN